ncbi:hypothetical protein NQZ68_001290 [Dissostichus eleginoides]|nr:hypothetical protein NQZ68_001290 [Dissostichus eleginoides]
MADEEGDKQSSSNGDAMSSYIRALRGSVQNSSIAAPWFFSGMLRCLVKRQRWSLPSHPLHVLNPELALTEMEGLLFDSALGGLLMVSKWSPPATALIIRDPGCMLEDRRGGPDQQSCTCVCSCVSKYAKATAVQLRTGSDQGEEGDLNTTNIVLERSQGFWSIQTNYK